MENLINETTVANLVENAISKAMQTVMQAVNTAQVTAQEAKQTAQGINQSIQEMKQSLQSAGVLSRDAGATTLTAEKSVEDPGTDEGMKLGTLSMTRSWNHNDKSLVEDARALATRSQEQTLSHRQNIETLQLMEAQRLSYLTTWGFAKLQGATDPSGVIASADALVSARAALEKALQLSEKK